jgi:outer membrane protein TolC
MGFPPIFINQKIYLKMKKNSLNRIYILLFILISLSIKAQNNIDEVLRFDEFLAYVKKYHPIVKQANLIINKSEAELLSARGGFDPKIEVDYDRKKFKNTEYYDKLNAAFKIPTWYGIELKANFEENQGDFLNPEASLPEDGLYSAGISFSVAQGFLINKRMADIKQAKLFINQAKADRDIEVNTILYQASLAYFNWLQAYNETLVFQDFLKNAETRFKAVKQNVNLGESAAIDSVEARITVYDRSLNFEKTKVNLMKSRLELSNFLWLNDVPVELQETMIPDTNTEALINQTLSISEFNINNFNIETHPKLQSLNYKYQSLNIDRRLKSNMLLPKIDLQYNFLSETPDVVSSFNTTSYKTGVTMSFPLFLRKERGQLKLSKLKMEDTNLEIASVKINVGNKIKALQSELDSFIIQNDITSKMVIDYELMLKAEERKFNIGESSLFLVNSRESKLIDVKLKAIELQNKFFSTKALLFNKLAVNPNL